MKPYRVRHKLVDQLPDGHLTLSQNKTREDGTLDNTGLWLRSHIHDELVIDLAEMHRHLSRSGLLLPGSEEYELWFERVSPERLPLHTSALHARHDRRAKTWDFEIHVRADMMTAEMEGELNDWAIKRYRRGC